MRAADEPEVRLLLIDRAAEQRLAAAAGDFARDVLLPQHGAGVRIERPDEPLLLRRDDDVASVSRRGERRRGGEVPVGAGRSRTVLRRIRNAAAAARHRARPAPAGGSGRRATGAPRAGPARTAGNRLRAAVVPDVERQRLHRPQDLARVHVDGHDRVGRLGRSGECVAGAEVQRAAFEIEDRRHPDAGARRRRACPCRASSCRRPSARPGSCRSSRSCSPVAASSADRYPRKVQQA